MKNLKKLLRKIIVSGPVMPSNDNSFVSVSTRAASVWRVRAYHVHLTSPTLSCCCSSCCRYTANCVYDVLYCSVPKSNRRASYNATLPTIYAASSAYMLAHAVVDRNTILPDLAYGAFASQKAQNSLATG